MIFISLQLRVTHKTSLPTGENFLFGGEGGSSLPFLFLPLVTLLASSLFKEFSSFSSRKEVEREGRAQGERERDGEREGEREEGGEGEGEGEEELGERLISSSNSSISPGWSPGTKPTDRFV